MDGRPWHPALNTARAMPQEILTRDEQKPCSQDSYPVAAYSLVVPEGR